MKIKEESAGSDEVLDVSHEKLSGAEFTFLHPGIFLKVKNSLEEVFFLYFWPRWLSYFFFGPREIKVNLIFEAKSLDRRRDLGGI